MGYNFSRFTRGIAPGSRIFAADGEPLSNDMLRAAVPSIFATEAHESRSARFAPVPTVTVLDGLRAEGFEPFSAVQARTRVEGKAEFTKHMVRLRHRSLTNTTGDSFEIVLVNANDGTSAYQMIPGFFRFVCENGLMTGETFSEVKVRHSGNAIGEVIEGAYRVLEDAPLVAEQVASWKAITLQDGERLALAESAHILRFPKADQDGEAPAPVQPEALLRPRRSADRATDLWTAFNVVQENTLKGGLTGRVRNAEGRLQRRTTREVAGIDQNRSLNRALWLLTQRMAELKSA
ncbi:DUF932 domain-containing protein [uncultured Paracoccus sp.]|uniref:DUF932 domain-containing protein n=1 Tax=uncultured Paracoccus sp. TaxID=189685 RepID=UPI00263562C9|nr:DUF932 domain-containing protein [uncultured Paracoccus sp.]